MKANPLSLPSALRQRLGPVAQIEWSAIGNAALLDEPLLGLTASRECPGGVFLETLNQVPQWVKDDRILLSGFHSPLEQQVLRSLLRRKGRAVKVLARGLTRYRAPAEEREALNENRMLVLTACPPEVRRITRVSAMERNRQVLALATEVVAPYVAEESPLANLLKEQGIERKAG